MARFEGRSAHYEVEGYGEQEKAEVHVRLGDDGVFFELYVDDKLALSEWLHAQDLMQAVERNPYEDWYDISIFE